MRFEMYHYFGKFLQPVCFFLALFFLGCSNVLINQQPNGVEVQMVLPEASGRNTESSSRMVKGWVENTLAQKLVVEQKAITANSVTLAFGSIQTGTRARVVIQIYDDSGILYSGSSDYFTVSKSGNRVQVRLEENTQSSETGNASSFSASDITVTVQSKTGTANKIEKSGSTSTTTVTHQFYGIEGSQINFSLSSKAQAAGMILKVNDTTQTSSDLKEAKEIYTAKILDQSNQEVAIALFDITSQMKPMTITFTELEFVSKAEASDESATISDLKINEKSVTLANYSVTATGSNGKATSMGMTDLTINNLTQTGDTIGITAGSASVATSSRHTINNASYKISDLYGKTSIMWGDYLRFTYTITQ